MASENRSALPETVPSLETVRGYVGSGLRKLAVLIVGAVWIAFWGLIARLHYNTGDLVSMAVVGVLFVLPAVLGVGYFLLNSLPIGRTP